MVFLAIGPVVSLVCYGLEVVADLCEQALSLLNGSQPYVFFVILPVALPRFGGALNFDGFSLNACSCGARAGLDAVVNVRSGLVDVPSAEFATSRKW